MDLPLFGGRKKRESNVIRDYERTLEEAKDAMNRGDDARAEVLLRRINRWVTEDLDRIEKMGEGERKKISQILTEAGETMLLVKDYDYAIKTLEKAKILDYRNVRAWVDIGRNLLERNVQIPYAVACLKEAVKLDPNNVEAHILLGDAFRIQGQINDAIESYRRALELDPKNETVISKLLKIQPDDIEVLKSYAEILKEKGDEEELLRVYNKLYSLTRDERYLEAGLDIDPGNRDLLITKVRFLMEDNNLVEANRIVEQLRGDYPDDPTVQMLYEELSGGEKEEYKPIAVDELFGDLGIDETLSEISEAEEIENEEELPAGQMVEEKVKTESPEINRVDEFLRYFDEDREKARELFEQLNDDEFIELMARDMDFDMANFILENVSLDRGNMALESMIAKKRFEYAERMLNEILKRNFKNAKALFYKGKLMAAKGNDMGARNFLVMSVKFDSSMKEVIRGDKLLQKYAGEEWFKKLIS